jgi:preprotein translocase subunit SecB
LPPDPAVHVRGQLLTVSLSELDFRRNPEFDIERHNASYSVDANVDVEVADDLRSAVATLRASIEWLFPETAEDRQGPFEISLVLTGMFAWMAESTTKDDIAGWIEFNAEHLLWPYLRAQIVSVTAASDLPPLTIYTIAVPRPRLGKADVPEEIEASPGS